MIPISRPTLMKNSDGGILTILLSSIVYDDKKSV